MKKKVVVDRVSNCKLNPLEMTVLGKALSLNSVYGRERRALANCDMGNVETELATRGYRQKRNINIATQKKYKSQIKQMDRDMKSLQPGEIKEYDIKFKDANGKDQNLTIGQVGQGTAHRYFVVDQDTGAHNYIKRSELKDILETPLRSQVKDENGLRGPLYTIRADDGSKMMCFDPKDYKDSKPIKDAIPGQIWVFENAKGEKTQVGKEGLMAFASQNNLSMMDIQRGKADKLVYAASVVCKGIASGVGKVGTIAATVGVVAAVATLRTTARGVGRAAKGIGRATVRGIGRTAQNGLGAAKRALFDNIGATTSTRD